MKQKEIVSIILMMIGTIITLIGGIWQMVLIYDKFGMVLRGFIWHKSLVISIVGIIMFYIGVYLSK